MILKNLRKLFIGESYEWNVTLTPDQVMKVLSEKDQGTYFNSPAGITVLVKDNKFSFYKITIGNIPMSYNHMAHMLVGYIENSKDGSKVIARFQLPFFISMLFIFLLVIPLFGAVIIILIALKNHTLSADSLLIFFPIAVLMTMKFLRSLAIKDEEKIISIIKDCLDPHKIT